MKHSFKKSMVIAAAVLMAFPGTAVFASGRGAQRNDRSCQNICAFIDADKDGICDNYDPENGGKRPVIQQDTSEQTTSGECSSKKHPRMDCRMQGQGQGRRRR